MIRKLKKPLMKLRLRITTAQLKFIAEMAVIQLKEILKGNSTEKDEITFKENITYYSNKISNFVDNLKI